MFQIEKCLPPFAICFALAISSGCVGEKAATVDIGSQATADVSDNGETPTEEAAVKPLSKLIKQYEPIANVLELNENEIAQIGSIHREYGDKLSQWHETDGKEMKAIQKQALQAARNRDKAALNRLNASGGKEKVAKFSQAEAAIQKAYAEALFDAIPGEKQDRWKAYRISTCLLEFLEPLNLSQEQMDSVRSLAPKAIRSIGNETNWQGYGTSKLEKLFETRVVTAEQKEDFENLKSKNRMRMLKWNN